MNNKTLNKIIYILVGIAILLFIVFIFQKITNKYEDKEVIEYNDPVEYFNSLEEEKDESKLKKGFTNIIDFLFYDKEIKGKKFSELKDDAKYKVMKVALSIDKKIEEKFPSYKEKISDKYKNIKSKVVEKYIDTTNKICSNNQELCINAKNDFNSLKESFGLTFDYIKKYSSKGLDKVREWYENFRG